MSFSARLSELGIELPEVAAPLASYIPAKSTEIMFTPQVSCPSLAVSSSPRERSELM